MDFLLAGCHARRAGFACYVGKLTLHHKTTAVRLLPAVILLKPISNVFIAWGTRQLPQSIAAHPAELAAAIANPLVIVGVGMQILWMLLRMRLLSVADLSYVLPVTAVGYVITTLLGRFLLNEDVSPARWAGTILITLGTALVASSGHQESRTAE